MATPTTTTFANTALVPGASYSFRVRALDAAANPSLYSPTASATTSGGCTSNGQCGSGFCVSGVCCDTACNGGCGACNLPGHVGTCTPLPNKTTCRAASNACDIAETCNGTSVTCPIDATLGLGASCDDGNLCTSADQCDATGTCKGTQLDCPGDYCMAAGTCNPTTGLCEGSAPAHEGLSCDDGNRCTVTSTCTGGSCVPEDPATGCTSGNFYVPVVNLGSAEGGSYAADINNQGEVVGVDARATYFRMGAVGPTPSTGFRWTPTVGRTPMPQPANMAVYPRGISNSGAVGGTLWDFTAGGERVFRENASTDTQLAIPVRGGYATDINNNDTITGYGIFDTTGYKMFRASPAGVEVLPVMAGDLNTQPNAIDDDGDLVGFTIRTDRTMAAIRYTDALGMEFLNRPGSRRQRLGPRSRRGRRLPARGQRYQRDPDRRNRPDRQRFDPRLRHDPRYHGRSRFGGHEEDRHDSEASRHRQLGGVAPRDQSLGGGGWGHHRLHGFYDLYAFIWVDGTGTVDLNDLIDPASGWTLSGAYAINDNHEIVGMGWINGEPRVNGQERAFKMKVPDLSPCPGADLCHTVAPRDLRSGSCPAPVAMVGVPACQEGLTLRVDGVADVGGGKLVALFGFNNSGSSPVLPTANVELVDGIALTSPVPAPPLQFPPGNYSGIFQPIFSSGQTVTWTVDGLSVSASASTPHSPTEPIGTDGGGLGVRIGPNLVTLKPDVAGYKTVPPEAPLAAGPTLGSQFYGTLNGQLTVSPTGSAIYSVPVSIPPGIAGMAPNLSLVYSSQSGDGVAGPGWDLAGLSIIHRCAKTIAHDGVARPIVLDELVRPDGGENDGICMDGKRLFEDPPGSGSYRAETTDFSTIRRDDDTGQFTVVTKSGEVRIYGGSADALVDFPRESADRNTPPTPGNEVAIWALSKVFDAWGNYFLVSYYADHAANGLRAKEIDYTGRMDPLAQQTTNDPFSYVKFDYEPRPDVRRVRFHSSTLPKTQRLTGITTPRGKYTLSYDDSQVTRSSLLRQVAYCDPTGTPPSPDTTETPNPHCLQSLRFDWNSNDVTNWVPRNNLAPPTNLWSASDATGVAYTSGTQFVDVDGDGRADLLVAKTGGAHNAWRNNGTSWDPRTDWVLPVDLAKSDGTRTTAVFADMNGDGLLDLVQDSACIGNDPCTNQSLAVWINRSRQGQGWVLDSSWTTPQAVNFQGGVQLGDLNGDGLPDLFSSRVVLEGENDPEFRASVMFNNGHGWTGPWVSSPPAVSSVFESELTYQLRDINRDGLADVVFLAYTEPPTGSTTLQVTQVSRLNLGSPTGLEFGPMNSQIAPNFYDTPPKKVRVPQFADVDGDGLMDAVNFYPLNGDGGPSGTEFRAAMSMGDGQGLGAADQAGYLASLAGSAPTAVHAIAQDDLPVPADFGYALADLNADGLVDLIRFHSPHNDTIPISTGGGQILFNTGTEWKDLHGQIGWTISPGTSSVPTVPDDVLVAGDSIFIDLDGDGMPDLARNSPSNGASTWHNGFTTPAITQFPNGTARKTIVTYSTISTADAQSVPSASSARDGTNQPIYSDTSVLKPGTKHLMMPIRVVSEIAVADGQNNGYLTSHHRYTDLRASAYGDGPLGFRTMTITDPVGIETTTTYAQGYPYTGIPIQVQKFSWDETENKYSDPVTETDTQLCDAIPTDPDNCFGNGGTRRVPRRSSFPYPLTVTDTSYLRTSTFPEKSPETWVTTTTQFAYDEVGNDLGTTIDIQSSDGTQATRSLTTKYYGAPTSNEHKLGKPLSVTVTNSQVLPADTDILPRGHSTTFEYQPISSIGGPAGGLKLYKKKIEFGSTVEGAEQDTAYSYDEFGNVTQTTVCGTSFDTCTPGALGPHRTTEVNYDPATWVPTLTTTTLPYTRRGLFPVSIITHVPDGIDQHSFRAYDPLTRSSDAGGRCQRVDRLPQLRRIGEPNAGYLALRVGHALRPHVPEIPGLRHAGWHHRGDDAGRRVADVDLHRRGRPNRKNARS